MLNLLNKQALIGALLLAAFSHSYAGEEKCSPSIPNNLDTPVGKVTLMVCSTKQPYSHHEWFELDGRRILEGQQLYFETGSKDFAVWIFGAPDLSYPRSKDPTGYGEITCSGGRQGLYLVDIAKKPPKVIQFGVDKACNEFDWSSWGTKNAVIALKKDVRFTYDRQTGQMSLPKDIDAIWEGMIIPTPTGKTSRDTPYPNYVKPYVKEIPLPAQAPK